MRRSKSLTAFLPQPVLRARGRPSELSDAQLHNRRDQLLQIFEGVWGQIGWELETCKKADDLILILASIADPKSWVRDVIIQFCLPYSGPASGTILRTIRAQRRALAKPIYDADESRRLAEERLRQVNSALSQAHGRIRRIVKRTRKMRRKEYARVTQQYSELYKRQNKLDLRLKGIQADFSRQELFDFLTSKRYVLTPTALANALAGLPYMGWRQSVRRCTKTRSPITNGLMYQIFKAIRYLTAAAKKTNVQALVKNFREDIPVLPSRYQLPKTELATNWLYLEPAIRQAYRTKSHREQLPFEITKRYFQRIQSQTQVDLVLAGQFKLALSNRQTKGTAPSPAPKPDAVEDEHDKIEDAST
jgi:hypothetical protein